MKYSYNWLKELSKTKLSPEKLADLLTMHAFEVESVEKMGANLDGVVVGKILKIKKHPGADKLQVAKVDIGEKKLDIVCGAPNIQEDDLVPVALVGTSLPNGMEIKEVDIRGIKSFGMLCAEDELRMGHDHSGILKLKESFKLGISLAEALGVDGVVMDIDVLSNRGHDALCHIGMAREICALEGRKFSWEHESIEMTKTKTKEISVEVKNSDLCPRYIGAVLEGVEVKDSPEWIKKKLVESGLNPINNIVDATNYVMMEFGQPLHAFDKDKLRGGKIIVRTASQGEKIELLDGNEKELDKEDLVIADEERAVAIAGIMGGSDSGVSFETTDIVLEAANFDFISVRKTRMRLGLKTESSDRFEKGIDPNLAEKAMARLIQIIQEGAGGELDGIIDIYPRKVRPWKIELDPGRVSKLLGEKIEEKLFRKILENLDLKVKKSGKIDRLEIEIPTVRIDLRNQEDLIEEIGRIYGYDKIKSIALIGPVASSEVGEERIFERKVKDILSGGGFSEMRNYSFYSQRDAGLAQIGSIRHLELENPMNPEQALMRVSLIPNVIKNVRENLKNFSQFNIFEIGRVYWPNGETLPEERRMIAGALVLGKDIKASGFYKTKGHLDVLLSRLGIGDYYYDNFGASPLETFASLWHEGRRAEIKTEGSTKTFGFLGEINPLVLNNFDVSRRVVMFELDLEALMEISLSEREYEPLRKFPTSTRDISMKVSKDIRVADVLSEIQLAGGGLVLDVNLFDVYEPKDEDLKSLAFHIIFGASERTLESKEVDKVVNKIIESLENNIGVEVRK